MSHLRSSLLAFLVLGVVVSGLADTFTNDVCTEKVAPGSETIKLSSFEQKLKYLQDMKNKWFKIESEEENTTPLNFADAINTYNSFPVIEKAFIPPGLKWCGDGDRAKNYDDLGYFKDTDMCCRDHDHCENNIKANKTLLNLKNTALFTRSACFCDNEFYKCLKKVNGIISKQIGNTYFNILQPQCFSCICRTDECEENDKTECKGKCDRYKWIDCRKF